MKVWYVPHGDCPEFVDYDSDRLFDESLSLSDEPPICVLYTIDKTTPNPYVAKFGQIFRNIPGDLMLIYENEDVPENIESLLPGILKKDSEKRVGFFQQMQAMGCSVIHM